MPADFFLLASLLALSAFIALPALAAARRRRRAREASEVATELAHFASAARRELASGAGCRPLEAALCARAERLRIPEVASLLLVHELPSGQPALLADTAQRFALRLKRRVAFERKMLARTASGRRRGALAAAIPPFALLWLRAADIEVPAVAFAVLLGVEAAGCWLLWRVSRVEI